MMMNNDDDDDDDGDDDGGGDDNSDADDDFGSDSMWLSIETYAAVNYDISTVVASVRLLVAAIVVVVMKRSMRSSTHFHVMRCVSDLQDMEMCRRKLS